MKHVTRNIKIIILNAVLFFVLCSMFYVPWALAHQVVEIRPAFAETAEGGLSNFHYLAQVKLETALPTIAGQPSPGEGLPEYINYLFVFGLGSISILALAYMIIGGIMYILAAGNSSLVAEAKDTIFQALLGVGILLVSYLLLRTINPDLVNLRNPNLAPTQLQNVPAATTPTTPPTPILPIGTTCSIGDQYPGFICVNGSWVRISGGASIKYPLIALIK